MSSTNDKRQEHEDDPFGGAPEVGEASSQSANENAADDAARPKEQVREVQTTVIGASGSGKSFLLAALQQGCLLSGRNGYRLTFTPKANDSDGRPSVHLIREAVDRIVSGDKTRLLATDAVTSYVFDLECKAPFHIEPRWFGQPRRTRMTLVDGPGGTLFPNQPTALTPQFEELMVERVREADSLVICIDSAKPQLAVFRKQFSALLERVGGKSRLGIPAKRVLVLLTKVDAAVAAAVQGAHRAHQQLQQDEWPTLALRVLRNNSITPYRLASLLSPFDFARATLDQATLSMIRRSLDSRAQMAIGVCSSTGFYSDGSVFWDDLRSEIYPRIAQGPDERLRNWTPFGIEEAIVFLASGRAFSTVNTYSAAQDWRASETRHRMRLRLKLSPTSR